MKKAVIYLTLLSVLFFWLPTGVFAGNNKHFSKHKFWWWPWKEVFQKLDSQQDQINDLWKNFDQLEERVLDLENQDGKTPETQYASFHVSVSASQNQDIITDDPQRIMFQVIDHNFYGTFLEGTYKVKDFVEVEQEIKYLIYLVPYDGVYQLSTNLGFGNSFEGSKASSSIHIIEESGKEIIKSTAATVADDDFASLGSSFTIYLNAGDQIYVTASCSYVGACQVLSQPSHSYFSGHFVHP